MKGQSLNTDAKYHWLLPTCSQAAHGNAFVTATSLPALAKGHTFPLRAEKKMASTQLFKQSKPRSTCSDTAQSPNAIQSPHETTPLQAYPLFRFPTGLPQASPATHPASEFRRRTGLSVSHTPDSPD